jgi:hypothetical protein
MGWERDREQQLASGSRSSSSAVKVDGVLRRVPLVCFISREKRSKETLFNATPTPTFTDDGAVFHADWWPGPVRSRSFLPLTRSIDPSRGGIEPRCVWFSGSWWSGACCQSSNLCSIPLAGMVCIMHAVFSVNKECCFNLTFLLRIIRPCLVGSGKLYHLSH